MVFPKAAVRSSTRQHRHTGRPRTHTSSASPPPAAVPYGNIGAAEQLLIDEIADHTDYILGEDQNNSFVSLLRDNGIETADQFVDSFCVEYEGILQSDEFVVIVFEGNSYFFRRLCSRSQ